MTECSVDAALSLVRWQRTRRGYDGDADLLQAGFALLTPDADGRFGPESALARSERTFNLPRQRVASEALQFAVFLVTKAKRDDDLRPHQTRQALRLLQLSLHAMATQDSRPALPLNACNLLLSALAEALENQQQDQQTLQSLRDVKAVLLFLFGLPGDIASFQMYRPPTNVYADFLKRALTAAFKSLTQLQEAERVEDNQEQEQLYVDVVHAALFVFQELQKTQTNKKKVFLAIAKTSLRDMVAYRHALVKLQRQRVPDVDAVTTLLDRIVEDALFDAEHIRQFDGAMTHVALWKKEGDVVQDEQDDKKAKKRRKAGGAKAAAGLVSYQKNLFDELLSLLSDQEVESELKASVGGFFEVLVRGFATRIRAAANTKIEDTKTDLKTSRKRAAIVIATTSTTYSPFKFWSELCAVAYAAFQQEAQKNTFLPVLVTLYNALFRALCECDVYRVTEDTEERAQFQTMENVLSSLLDVLKVEHSGEISGSADRASEECEIVSSAVRCSPNLVNRCLVPIFELLGVHAVRSYPTAGDGVIAAASQAVVELVHAYDSMRLLDAFLKSAFAIQQAHAGLYRLFAVASCETTFRKAFMALPPGQMDVLWNLLVDHIASYAASDDDARNAREVAVARLLFQTFVQEVHVVPQNRSKVLGLVSSTHEKLLASFAKELGEATGPFTSYQRELFCVFGELLMFDSVLNASVREQTFAQVFAQLEGERFGNAMEQLLSTASPKKKRSKSHASDRNAQSLSASHGLGAAGIVKLCVYWLRMSSGAAEKDAKSSREGREKVTRLVIEYVVSWKCWEAVSFHLLELMANASTDECGHFIREILSAFVDEAVAGELDGSARRIVCDAGFYEISSLRDVAPGALTTMVARFVDEVQRGSLTSAERPLRFFNLLLELPAAYLIPQECGELLATVLSFYKAIAASDAIGSGKSDVARAVLTWIQLHFKLVGGDVHGSLDEKLRDGARFIISKVVVDEAVDAPLVAEVLGHFSDIGAGAFVGELLHSVLDSNTEAKTPADKTARNLKRAVVVVEALASYRGAAAASSEEEKQFVESVVDAVARAKGCEGATTPLSFDVLTALLKYQSVLYKQARQHKNQQTAATEGRALQLLVKRVGPALASSMKLIVAADASAADVKLQDAAWCFFANFCEEYASFRAYVTPLETYGCLLAVSLSRVSCNSLEAQKQKRAEGALHAVLGNANKDEFRLLISTLEQELAASESQRKQGALRALCLLLGGDRKLTAARRVLLNERKESIVDALLQNFALQSLHVGAESDGVAVPLRVWNMKAFVLVFCKAELFTWKTHELQHVFTGFQPLVAAVSCWQAGTNAYSPQELHELWTLSYTLLLRIVRNHFASLVNGIPHLVQAANALLQLLVLTCGRAEYAKLCLEWSSNLARLYGYMKEHDVQLRKHVVYLLMAFLVGVTRDKLPVRFQQKLRPGVFALLDVCSPYEKEQLFGALDSTGKSLLKTLDTNYKLTHRYVGKV